MIDRTGDIERAADVLKTGGLVAASHRCETGVLELPDGSPNTDGTGDGAFLVHPHRVEGP